MPVAAIARPLALRMKGIRSMNNDTLEPNSVQIEMSEKDFNRYTTWVSILSMGAGLFAGGIIAAFEWSPITISIAGLVLMALGIWKASKGRQDE